MVVYSLLLPLHSGNREGVEGLYIVISFILSVIAGVAANYICKWLDRQGRKPKGQ